MSSFTTADRRKKVITYGKKSRPSIIPTPPPDLAEEPPSPNRPRKTVARKNEASHGGGGGALKPAKAAEKMRPSVKDHDIFDVPSDDELPSRPIRHAKKPRIPEANRHVPAADTEASTRSRKQHQNHTPQQLPKPKTTKPEAADAKIVRKADRPTPAGNPTQAPKSTTAPALRRGRTPQPVQDVATQKSTKQPVADSKTISRATTPAVSASKPMTKARGVPATTLKKATTKTTAKASGDMDVYDMPLSDDEMTILPRKPLRIGRVSQQKNATGQQQTSKERAPKHSAESDDSNISKKRKRRGSVSAVNTGRAQVSSELDLSAPQRSRKLQRKEDGISPRHEDNMESSMVPSQPRAPPTVPAINKPRRTRQLTVPVFSRRKMSTGQSSPAKLSNMLHGSTAKSPSILEAPHSPRTEDETMYEIPNPLTTPIPSKSTVSGSVTPRQKALFSSLLGDQPSRTPMPSLASLTLTDQKPRTLLGALSRSKSDMTHSAQARKMRLIDTLKDENASSEDDEEMGSSDDQSEASSEQSLGEGSASLRRLGARIDQSAEPQFSADVHLEDMDVELERAVESQTSQTTSFGTRAKLTYAKSRSYLEEANPEDALLILDDDLDFDTQTKDGLSGDDEGPASQVQATHVLKKKGQQNTFNDDVRMYIDDLPISSGNTVRRSAILELCSRMEDEAFSNQLLDSTLARSFFENINSNGEVIFDVVTAVVVTLILQASPTSVVLDQIYRAGVVSSLVSLATNDVEIMRLAKNRKTNLSLIAVESVKQFHCRLSTSSVWSEHGLDRFTPQVLALKALESLVVGLRRSGSAECPLDQDQVLILIEVASKTCARIEDGKVSVHDSQVLYLVVSILESVSGARQKPVLWSGKILGRLAEVMPVVFGLEDASSTMLTVKLCMNLTNNKPKACLPFSGEKFVQPLVSGVTRNFARLRSELSQEERTTVLEMLILSLGALINLAEFSDQARLSVDDGQQMISTLVRIFVEGSERAAQAQSMEESQSNVPVGYLTVLLGNLCLNDSTRSKVCAQLPDQRLGVLITKIREFVQYHEHVDGKTEQYEGAEGRETWQNYTARLMLVVEKLERTER
ncbi:hypothetical protein IAQ61_011935 [Plenodomus lingam]|uniref:Wings apart-like protein C-terminal domain-containing protein n=1 Tax=Leptosphaeria maculans (strain JN3 / isolate v23.1.3 / race Av1-4-5-6-7-8) TaxID=985895 RepID=E5ABJ8_LEPMJ|nr:hypothetical protein LEMA_P021690.1 [Plenodomus lingam JN3]KAH9860151.1 hypothetical protein IAQ61_011935 [Plenodomus lingam]CBY01039.1 hypothetical protein LEMA_P021690.1 [Plenodomus lingam JN3]